MISMPQSVSWNLVQVYTPGEAVGRWRKRAP